MYRGCFIVLGALLWVTTGAEVPRMVVIEKSVTLEAEQATLEPQRAEIVRQSSFDSGRGVVLRDGVTAAVSPGEAAPDVVFRVRAAVPGRYVFRTHAATNAAGTELMSRTQSKHGSLRLMLAVGDGRPTRRVVFVPWSRPQSCTQTLGKFILGGEEEDIRIWLPEGVILDRLQIFPYLPPKVPEAVRTYEPRVTPPGTRPRLWVNAEGLARIRGNLTRGANAPLWEKVREEAVKPYRFEFTPGEESSYDAALERAVVVKAFVHLMSGDAARGREAVELTRAYLRAVEFGNLLDITREIGRAIYAAARVYDWCYGLMSMEERDSIRSDLMRLADDMEIGWPPFRQMIVNGHGNEAQVNRDLLCMAIAVYDEDPEPYRYCAYRILEELVPMRRFEYQSPRHNQGVSYGPYRFGWDLHAAILFHRMSGRRVFDDNIMDVCRFWFYMRTANGETLRDGDGFADGRPASLGATALLSSAYANDPIAKYDFERQGGLPYDPILVLLLNDPDLEAAAGFDSLPLTKDFGPILGSMIARTGWNMGRNLADVVVEMKGGGYHFGNHQHSDAGSFQVYYRGLQVADLGQYRFYGTPYDMNFCKRSISHSMMLAVDPGETFGNTISNDGGTRFMRSCPLTPEQTRTDPRFANGTVLAADFGPDRERPFYSYFSVDLTSAYSEKISSYVRSFCFLNLDSTDTPAALIILDNMTTARQDVRKYWQVNTLTPPERTREGVILRNRDLGLRGKVDLRMLRPRPHERTLEILSGNDAHTVFGKYFEPPKPDRPEANGHRVMFSPAAEKENDLFLTVLTMSAEKVARIPVELSETEQSFVLTLADRIVVLGKGPEPVRTPLRIEVAGEGERQVILAGWAPGTWGIRSDDGLIRYNLSIAPRQHSAFLLLPAGRYTLSPGMLPGAAAFQAPADSRPTPAAALAHGVFLDGELLDLPATQSARTCPLLPAAELARTVGFEASEQGGRLTLNGGGRTVTFQADSADVHVAGLRFRMPAEARVTDGSWFVPDTVIAPLLDLSLLRESAANCSELERMRIPNREDILWIEANTVNHPHELHAMLADIPGRRAYWAGQGKDVYFDLALARPVRLQGVGIRWHLGATRQASFAVETSLDGETWTRVFEGASSGTTADLEHYMFPVHTARHVRFRGFGNTSNDWNSLVHFRILPSD